MMNSPVSGGKDAIYKKKTVLFVCPSLEAGGAERICINIMNHIDRSRFSPLLVLFAYKGRFVDQVPADVPVIDMKKKKGTDFLKLVFSLAFRILPRIRPDVVVSFLWYTNIVCIISRMLSPRKPFLIASEHNNTSQSRSHRGLFRKWMFCMLYRRVDRIIAVSKGIGRELESVFRVPAAKIAVIYNCIDHAMIAELSSEKIQAGDVFKNPGALKVISCGRLTKQKNYPLLLRAFARLVSARAETTIEGKDIELVIIGEGEERQRLRMLSRDLGIETRVGFPGFRANPWKYMAASDVFVLSSLYEGFGNVIIEAMACGVPVISVDCRYGPAEIITSGKNGILAPVDDAEALAQEMLRLLADADRRKRIAVEARKRAMFFDVKNMVKQYEEIL